MRSIWMLFHSISKMALTARVLFTLFVLCHFFQNTRTNTPEDYEFRIKDVPLHFGYTFGRVILSGRKWRKLFSSKFYRKSCCRRPPGLTKYANNVTSETMEPFFFLLLSGDVELNPGPTNTSKSNKQAAKEGNSDFAEILLRLEQKFDSGQEIILQNQTQMMNRLSSLEAQIEKFNVEIEELKSKITNWNVRLSVCRKMLPKTATTVETCNFSLIDRNNIHEKTRLKSKALLRKWEKMLKAILYQY